jgi:hypothetical protein
MEGHVLQLAARVGEAQVHILDVLVLHKLVKIICHFFCLLMSVSSVQVSPGRRDTPAWLGR